MSLPVDPQLGLRQWEAPHTLPCPWSVCSTHVPTTGAIFKVTALQEQCAVEATWMVHVIEPREGFCTNF